MGAAAGAFLGGLLSRNAASTGAATGALIGAILGEKRHDFDDIIESVREGRREESESEGRLSRLQSGSERRFAKLRESAPQTSD